MTATVRFHRTALAQLDEFNTWWRVHRSAAATQVTDEVDRIMTLLAESPNVGTPYLHEEVSGVRMVRLQRTPYRLYYVHDVERDVIVVVAVWSSMREAGPPITDP